MALPVTFLFTGPLTRPRIGSLVIDAVMQETHEASTNVTEEPVDVDAILNDHIVNLPEKVTIQGMITSTPITGGSNLAAAAAFETLYEMRNSRRVMTVVTSYRVYTNMAINRITIPRTPNTGEAIEFTVELMKVNRLGTLLDALFAFIEDELAAQLSVTAGIGRVGVTTAGAGASAAAGAIVGGMF